jgi:hypothetical protein
LTTFDLIWTLFMPNDLALTTPYGCGDEYRFKIEHAAHIDSKYTVQGHYIDSDGERLFQTNSSIDISSFDGARGIADLSA